MTQLNINQVTSVRATHAAGTRYAVLVLDIESLEGQTEIVLFVNPNGIPSLHDVVLNLSASLVDVATKLIPEKAAPGEYAPLDEIRGGYAPPCRYLSGPQPCVLLAEHAGPHLFASFP